MKKFKKPSTRFWASKDILLALGAVTALLSLSAPASGYQAPSRAEFSAFGADARLYELPPGDTSMPADGRLRYVNPRSSATSCGIPLSIQEKMAQQGLRQHAERMRAQGIDESEFRVLGLGLLSQQQRSMLMTLVRDPSIVSWIRRLFEIRENAWDLQAKYFDRARLNGIDDEADAFRHFVFMALIMIEAGERIAVIVSDGHELYDRTLGTLMDRYNDRVAIEILRPRIEKLRKLDGLDLEGALRDLALEHIQSGRLVVLRRKLEATPEPSAEFYRFAHDLLKTALP